VSKGNSQNRLASFMVARADPHASPQLESLEMPSGSTVQGPVQVNRAINTQQDISSQFTLLSRGGSTVQQGQIQIVPVKNSLLYIQPVYVLSESGNQPALSFVIVYYNGRAKFGSDVADALNQFPAFAGTAPPPSPSNGPATPPSTIPGTTSTVDQLIAQANQLSKDAQSALDAKDLGTYQSKVKQLSDVLNQLVDARSRETGTSSTSTSSTTTTTKPKSSSTQALGARG
jgi:uncharacterized membrane protein (UPF0182 family)